MALTPLSAPEATPLERVHWAASAAVFLLFAVGTMCLIVRLHPGAGSAFRSLAHTSSPRGATAPADPTVIDDDSTLVFSTPTPPAPVRPPAATARAESSLVESPKIGLEVARYIVRERARVESRRLTAKGLKARVLTGWESGAPVFRVVLGPYATRSEAERVADDLLSRNLVDQARVVTVKLPASRSAAR